MSKNCGILYALKNELWQGNLKCGLTTQKIEKRISNLQTSLFIDCELISKTNQLVNCKIYEFLLKKILKEYRVRDDREFFNVEIDIIKEIFETFNYINLILDTDEKLNNYIENFYPEYLKKRKYIKSEKKLYPIYNKKKLKKKKAIYIDTTY
jgi:hypothetical protein